MIDRHRLVDVLQLLFPALNEHHVELAPDLLVDLFGNADFSGSGNQLQSRSDIDAVAEKIVVVDDDIADVYADAKLHCGAIREMRIAFANLLEEFQRTKHRLNRAVELRNDGIFRLTRKFDHDVRGCWHQ